MNPRPAWLRSVGGAITVVALLAASLALVALAADVLRWDRELRETDVAYAAGTRSSWAPDTLFPKGVSKRLLGVGDDVEFRAAVARFWASDPRAPLREFADVTRRSAAERGVARLAGREQNASRRSTLITLRSALLLEEARNSPTQRQVFVRRAIEQLEQAVRIDPRNEDAIYDLELALKLLRASGEGEQGAGDRRAPLPSPGAGSSTSGSGF